MKAQSSEGKKITENYKWKLKRFEVFTHDERVGMVGINHALHQRGTDERLSEMPNLLVFSRECAFFPCFLSL